MDFSSKVGQTACIRQHQNSYNCKNAMAVNFQNEAVQFGKVGKVGKGAPHIKQHQHYKSSNNAVAINRHIVEAAQTHDLSKLLWTIDKNLPHMNIVNLSTAVHRLAKLACTNSNMLVVSQSPLLCELLEVIDNTLHHASLGQVKPQSVSNILWAFASMHVVNRPIIQQCMQIFEQTLASFKPFEFATTLWAFAKLRTFEPTGFPSMKIMLDFAADHLTQRAEEFEFRCLSMIVWSYATSHEVNAHLFDHLGTQLAQKASGGCGQELSLTAWAFGTTGVHHPALFDMLTVKAIKQMDTFKPQELSNLVWGCASSGYFHHELFTTALASAKQKQLSSQHLANILWACSRATPYITDPLFAQKAHFSLLPQCMEQLHTFKAEEAASVALSSAKAFGRDSLQDCLKRTHQAPANKDVSICPPLVLAFFKQLIRWTLPRIKAVPRRVLISIVETYSRVCMLPLDGEDSEFFLIAAGELVLGMSNLCPELLIRVFQIFSVGEPASIAGMAAGIEPLATHLAAKARCFNKGNLKDLASTFVPYISFNCNSSTQLLSHVESKLCDARVPISLASHTNKELFKECSDACSEACSEVGSAQPTDEPSSEAEDQDSNASWESDHLTPLSGKVSVTPWDTEVEHEFTIRCVVKNTFLHMDVQTGEGSAQRRSCSAPACSNHK